MAAANTLAAERWIQYKRLRFSYLPLPFSQGKLWTTDQDGRQRADPHAAGFCLILRDEQYRQLRLCLGGSDLLVLIQTEWYFAQGTSKRCGRGFNRLASCFLPRVAFVIDEQASVPRHPLSIQGPVAQRLEQGTHNPLVVGSNPTGPTFPQSRRTPTSCQRILQDLRRAVQAARAGTQRL